MFKVEVSFNLNFTVNISCNDECRWAGNLYREAVHFHSLNGSPVHGCSLNVKTNVLINESMKWEFMVGFYFLYTNEKGTFWAARCKSIEKLYQAALHYEGRPWITVSHYWHPLKHLYFDFKGSRGGTSKRAQRDLWVDSSRGALIRENTNG